MMLKRVSQQYFSHATLLYFGLATCAEASPYHYRIMARITVLCLGLANNDDFHPVHLQPQIEFFFNTEYNTVFICPIQPIYVFYLVRSINLLSCGVS